MVCARVTLFTSEMEERLSPALTVTVEAALQLVPIVAFWARVVGNMRSPRLRKE